MVTSQDGDVKLPLQPETGSPLATNPGEVHQPTPPSASSQPMAARPLAPLPERRSALPGLPERRLAPPTMDLDQKLMASVRAHWGQLIGSICLSSSVEPAFLAALIAGEGVDTAKPPRFEPNVYFHLKRAQQGRQTTEDVWKHRPAHYGPIVEHNLLGYTDLELRAFASSWGLTQIMGYHILPRWAVGDGPRTASLHGSPEANPKKLLDARCNLEEALQLVGGFSHQFNLDVRVEFEELFRCWNTGQPDRNTFDPHYVANGLRRLVMYREG